MKLVTILLITLVKCSTRFLQDEPALIVEGLPPLGEFTEASSSFECLSRYNDSYYCSTAHIMNPASGMQSVDKRNGICCGDFSRILENKPAECFSVPDRGYWCGNAWNLTED